MSRLFYEKPNINVSHVSGSSNVVIQNSNSIKETFTNPNFKIVPVFIKEQNKELLKYEIHRKQFLWFWKPIKITQTIEGIDGKVELETNKKFDTLIEAQDFIKTLNNCK